MCGNIVIIIFNKCNILLLTYEDALTNGFIVELMSCCRQI